MKITICGSMHHRHEMIEANEQLQQLGFETEHPDLLEEGYDTRGKTEQEKADDKNGFIRKHLDKIASSDAILVINNDKNGVANYVGGNSLMEMAFAYAQGIQIFLLNPTPNISYAAEINGMRPVILNGKLEHVAAYSRALPRTFVSSASPLKLRAVSRALQRAGLHAQVVARPTKSNVAEQPKSIEETYEGAQNRHAALAQATANEKPDFLVTIESGNHVAHPQHNFFSSTVVILEKVNGERKVGINLELELPKEMTDKVPSQYPDLGVLVQKEYGSLHKDPFPFFTNGKINRLKLLEDAVFNVAVQLKT